MIEIIFVVLLVTATAWVNAADHLCTEDFCSYYVEKNECMTTSTACNIQNKTYSGEFFPGEVPCGCCNVCLQNLREGDPCTAGSPDVTPPMLICGPGLYCKKSDNSAELTCQKMDHTECFMEQILFDRRKAAGEIWSFVQRPRCDGDGNFLSAKCNDEQTCFCVNQNGVRIFGEATYSAINEYTMNCECSRMNDNFNGIMKFKYPILTARCQDDGSFDPLQCMDGKCLCVESQSGAPSGDITLITNSDYNQMPCFDRKLHLEYKYQHDCEEGQTNLIQEIDAAKSQQFTLLGYEFPRCQPDGWFGAVQSNETSLFCVDKYNRKIGSFEAKRGTPEAVDMNCNCARTRLLLRKNKAKYLPQCTSNGSFEKMQCRDETCYCVDENGLQVTKDVSKTSDLRC